MPTLTPPASSANSPRRCLVVDTNVVLDLLLFRDPEVHPVGVAASSPRWVWIASQAMRDELEHVLHYVWLARRLADAGLDAGHLLSQYDESVRRVAAAPLAGARCKDSDDQKFIDLAVQHGAVLLSKDKAVLKLTSRLSRLGASVLKPTAFVA